MFQQAALLTVTDKLERFALRLTRNAHDAEDLVQGTLLRAMENRENFQDDTNLFSWTSKIMFNLFASGYRRKKKFETQYDPTLHIDNLSVYAVQEDKVDLGIVGGAIQRLQPEHREILMLICVKGMRYEEASEMLQVPVGTVRSRLSRARHQLKHMLSLPHAGAVQQQNVPQHRLASAVGTRG